MTEIREINEYNNNNASVNLASVSLASVRLRTSVISSKCGSDEKSGGTFVGCSYEVATDQFANGGLAPQFRVKPPPVSNPTHDSLEFSNSFGVPHNIGV